MLDVGLAALAGGVWYVRPQEGVWPVALVAVAWSLRLLAYGSATHKTPFDLPLALFLLTGFGGAVVGYNHSMRWLDPANPLMWSWAKYWYLVAAVALFFAVANLRETRHVWWFVCAFAVLAVVVAVYFVLTNDWTVRAGKFDSLSQIGAWLSEPLPDVSGRRLHPNVVGGIIAVIAPFFVPLLVESARHWRALTLWGAACLLALTGLLLSASRGAWLALAVTLLLWALTREVRALAQRRTRLRVILLSITLLCVAVVVASIADTGTIGNLQVALSASLPGFGTGSVVSRITLWQGALALGQDHFLTGAGLGTFSLLFSAYELLIPVMFVPHGHNFLLDMLVEQGLFGLLAFVWVLLAAVLAVGRGTARLSSDGEGIRTRWLLEAAAASLCVMVLHNMVDDVPYGSRALILLFVPMAVIAALTHGPLARDASERYARSEQSSRWSEWRIPLVSIAALAGLLLWQRESLLGMVYANFGALSQERVELSAYQMPDRLPETARREVDLSAAVAEFQAALAHDPGNRTANQRLSMIALSRAQYERGLAYAEAAYRVDPSSETTWQLLADAYLAAGRADDAYRAWSRVADADAKLELTASLRYDKLNDRERAAAARALADRIRNDRKGTR